MADVAVALLDADTSGASLAGAIADRLGTELALTTPDDHLATVTELASRHRTVVGLSRLPWPRHAALHTAAGTAVAAYRGVVAWHGLPRLLDELAQAAAPGARAGAHLLITAPDPGADATPDEVVFLREVAEGIAARTEVASRSIAWRGTTRTPIATEALTSVVEVHGKRDVVEVPVAPGAGQDASLLAVAERLGARLTTVDLATRVLVESLAEVVATVAAHERGEAAPQDGPGADPATGDEEADA